ncbi:MAG: tetratricopeptide repeat protein [Pyrinomonadaceae bacterium]
MLVDLSSLFRAPLVHGLIRAAFLVALLVSATTIALAQSDTGIDPDPGDPGTGGVNTIQGRVYAPSGRQLGRRVRVRLGGVRGEQSVMSDDNGAFTFRRLAGGTYRLTVEAGKEFETANESVDIIDPPLRSRRGGQIFSVQIQLQTKRQLEAKPGIINAALAAIPKSARELYEGALVSAQAGEHKRAVEQLKKAVVVYPEFSLAFNELGVQYLKLGETGKAAEALRAALKLAPGIFVLHFNYGIILIQQKHFAEAEAELGRTLELDEAAFAAHLYRGRALIGLLRYDEAERALQRALALGGDGRASMAHRYLGAIYIERGENRRAVEALETYLRLEPKAGEAAQIREIIKGLRPQNAPPQK